MNENKSSMSRELYKKRIYELKNELNSKSKVLSLLQKLESLTEIEKLIKRNLKLLEIKKILIKRIYELKRTDLLERSSGDCSNCKSVKTKKLQKMNATLFRTTKSKNIPKYKSGLYFEYISPESTYLKKYNESEIFSTRQPSLIRTTEKEITLENDPRYCCFFNKFQFPFLPFVPKVSSISMYSVRKISEHDSDPNYKMPFETKNPIKSTNHNRYLCPRCGFDYSSPNVSVVLSRDKSVQTTKTILEPQSIRPYQSSMVILQPRSYSLNTLHFSIRTPYSSETTNSDSKLDLSYLLVDLTNLENNSSEHHHRFNNEAISNSGTDFDLSHLVAEKSTLKSSEYVLNTVPGFLSKSQILPRNSTKSLNKNRYVYITQTVPDYLKSKSIEWRHFNTIEEDFSPSTDHNLIDPKISENAIIEPKRSSINLKNDEYTKQTPILENTIDPKRVSINKEKFIKQTDLDLKNEENSKNICPAEDTRILSIIKRFEDFEKAPSFYVYNKSCNAKRKTPDHLTINCNKDGCTTFKHTCSAQSNTNTNCLQNIENLNNIEETNCFNHNDSTRLGTNKNCFRNMKCSDRSSRDQCLKNVETTRTTRFKTIAKNGCQDKCFRDSKTIPKHVDEECTKMKRNNLEIRKSCNANESIINSSVSPVFPSCSNQKSCRDSKPISKNANERAKMKNHPLRKSCNDEIPIINSFVASEISSCNHQKCSYFKQNDLNKFGTVENNFIDNKISSDEILEETFWFKIIEKFIQYTILNSKKCACVSEDSHNEISRSYTSALSRNMDEIIELLVTVRNNYMQNYNKKQK